MAQTVSLSANPRQATGKGAARQARFRGKVPAVIYGHGRDSQPLELEAKALEKALQGVEPASTIIELAVDGKTVKTLIREIQRHPSGPTSFTWISTRSTRPRRSSSGCRCISWGTPTACGTPAACSTR